ncbi:hypothetical protein [Rhizobium etli]|uniref:hypothetical protein n=1 Tax=Rhizobium etli TaxID=29449 RepID=UPI003B589A3C
MSPQGRIDPSNKPALPDYTPRRFDAVTRELDFDEARPGRLSRNARTTGSPPGCWNRRGRPSHLAHACFSKKSLRLTTCKSTS